jgi:hypothetical protein
MNMQYSHGVHFVNENELPDDVDCLFEQLPRVAPPSSLIKRILEQTPLSYAYDAFPVSPPCYLQDQSIARHQLERPAAAPRDVHHKRSHLC